MAYNQFSLKLLLVSDNPTYNIISLKSLIKQMAYNHVRLEVNNFNQTVSDDLNHVQDHDFDQMPCIHVQLEVSVITLYFLTTYNHVSLKSLL